MFVVDPVRLVKAKVHLEYTNVESNLKFRLPKMPMVKAFAPKEGEGTKALWLVKVGLPTRKVRRCQTLKYTFCNV